MFMEKLSYCSLLISDLDDLTRHGKNRIVCGKLGWVTRRSDKIEMILDVERQNVMSNMTPVLVLT